MFSFFYPGFHVQSIWKGGKSLFQENAIAKLVTNSNLTFVYFPLQARCSNGVRSGICIVYKVAITV